MTKDVLLTLAGVRCEILLDVEDNPEVDPVEVITPASYSYENGEHYIMYEEPMEGLQERVKNEIRISDGRMELTKSGPMGTHLLFEKDKLSMSEYETPFGAFTVGIYTKDMKLDVQENEIDQEIHYTLEINDVKTAKCDIHVHVSANEKGA